MYDFILVSVTLLRKLAPISCYQLFISDWELCVKDNLFSYKIPEVTREMIDVLVVIKIPD